MMKKMRTLRIPPVHSEIYIHKTKIVWILLMFTKDWEDNLAGDSTRRQKEI